MGLVMSINIDLRSVTYKLNSRKIGTLNLADKDWKAWNDMLQH